MTFWEDVEMNRKKLLMVIGNVLILGACTPQEHLSTESETVMNINQTNTTNVETEPDNVIEEQSELVMTSISLEEYMEDAEENKNYSIGDQKYLSPNKEKVLTFNTENSTVEIANIVDGYLSIPTILDLTKYLSPEETYNAQFLNAGWYGNDEIFITTTLELIIHNLTDGIDTMVSADFRPTYDEYSTFKFIDWLTPVHKAGDFLVYEASRPLDFNDQELRIFLGDKNGEQMILEGYSIVASNDNGFAYVDKEGHADELWWYDTSDQQSYLIYELDVKLDGQYPISKEYIGYFNNMTKQEYYENPEFKCVDDIFEFIISDVETLDKTIYQYDTVTHELIK